MWRQRRARRSASFDGPKWTIWSFVLLCARAAGGDPWCPWIDFSGTPRAKCDPRQQRFLFVMGTGRSGSTTVLNMINGLGHGINIGGENCGMLTGAIQLWTAATLLPSSFFEGEEATGVAFQHGRLTPENLICDIQEWFLDMDPYHDDEANVTHPLPGEVRGFKEIRNTMPEDRRAVEKFFPCSRVILNYRKDVRAQLKSAFWGETSEAEQQVLNKTQGIVSWHEAWGPQRSFLLALEDFSVEKFEELRRWLGVEDCAFLRVREDNKAFWTDKPLRNGQKHLMRLAGEYLPDMADEPFIMGECSVPFGADSAPATPGPGRKRRRRRRRLLFRTDAAPSPGAPCESN